MMYANSLSKALAMSTLLCSDTILAGRVMRDLVASRTQRRRLMDPKKMAKELGYEGPFDPKTEHFVMQPDGDFEPENIIDTYKDMGAQGPHGKFYTKAPPSHEYVQQLDGKFKKKCKDKVDVESGNRLRNGKWQLNQPKPQMVQVQQADGTLVWKRQTDSDNAIGNLRGRVGWFNGSILTISALSLTAASFVTGYNASLGWSLFLFIAFAASLTFGVMRVSGFGLGFAAVATVAAGLFTAGVAHGGLVSTIVKDADFNTHGSLNFGLIGAGLALAFVLVVLINWKKMASLLICAGPKKI